MTKAEIISALKANFNIKELVCPHTYARYGENSWLYMQTPILHTLLVLRTKILNVPLTINTYPMRGTITQRGLRCNLCPMVKNDKTEKGLLYLSAHIQGLALDIVSSKMTAEQMRQKYTPTPRCSLIQSELKTTATALRIGFTLTATIQQKEIK